LPQIFNMSAESFNTHLILRYRKMKQNNVLSRIIFPPLSVLITSITSLNYSKNKIELDIFFFPEMKSGSLFSSVHQSLTSCPHEELPDYNRSSLREPDIFDSWSFCCLLPAHTGKHSQTGICLQAIQPGKITPKSTQSANKGAGHAESAFQYHNYHVFSRIPVIGTTCENKLFMVQEKEK
jgi:hypothetical protein